jgi:hypothetical protein
MKPGGGCYRELALWPVDQVHHTLGRHVGNDIRNGWLSGLRDQVCLGIGTAAIIRISRRERLHEAIANPSSFATSAARTTASTSKNTDAPRITPLTSGFVVGQLRSSRSTNRANNLRRGVPSRTDRAGECVRSAGPSRCRVGMGR